MDGTMIHNAPRNCIYTAIAAPGSGKTEALLSKLPDFLEEGERVVLALPTLTLCSEIERRAVNARLPCRLIDSRQGEVVVTSLEEALISLEDSFIICTQESIRRVRHHLLGNWVLVIDEVPKVVDYPDYALKPSELGRILEFTEERDGQLRIPVGTEHLVQEQVATNRADARGVACSTLGSSAAHIFRMLLSGVDVFIDSPQSDSKRHIRAVEEFTDWWPTFHSARAVHVLAANIADSEFEIFARINGFDFKPSEFTPPTCKNLNRVTIHPVLSKDCRFSKRLMEAMIGEERLIDVILKMAIGKTSNKPLLFANKWANYQRTPGVHYLDKDSRGLNGYSHINEAIVLFGGNPSPSDSLGLSYLKAKYGTDFETAFITTRYLEASLQAVTRTAIRCYDQTQDIHLYVQDYRVVRYLMDTYFPDAVVDWSFSTQVPVPLDGRRLSIQKEEEVKRLLAEGVAKIEIQRRTEVSCKKIRKIDAEMKKTALL